MLRTKPRKTARGEYAMRFNICKDGNETWFVFDMDTDERVAEGYEHRSSALADCQFRNRQEGRKLVSDDRPR